MAAPSDRNSRSTPERAVWGDVEDWHCTLDLIARKWGPPTLQPPLARSVSPGSASSTDPLTTAVAPTAAEQPGGVQATTTAPSQSTPIEGLRNKSPVGRAPAVDSPRLAGKPSVSSRKRHTASLPRPSDVEALLRKETQRRRPTSPHSFPHSPSSDSRDAVSPGHFVDQTSSSPSSSSSFSSAPPALPTTPSTDHEAAGDPEASSKPRASSYSAPTDLRNAFVTVQHHQPGGGAPNNDGVILSLLELQKRPVPASLNKATLEAYLSDDEFSSALGMPRDQFYGLRAWKQTQVKKKAGLL